MIFLSKIKITIMDILDLMWGTDDRLGSLQMGTRAAVTFLIALMLIRLSGRRSFGSGTATDNIIVILLGAILSRAVVGASPFFPIVFSCLVIVLLHRVISLIKIKAASHVRWLEGKKIILYRNGNFLKDNMAKALVTREDVLRGVRLTAGTDDLSGIQCIYMEANGEISVTRKSKIR